MYTQRLTWSVWKLCKNHTTLVGECQRAELFLGGPTRDTREKLRINLGDNGSGVNVILHDPGGGGGGEAGDVFAVYTYIYITCIYKYGIYTCPFFPLFMEHV